MIKRVVTMIPAPNNMKAVYCIENAPLAIPVLALVLLEVEDEIHSEIDYQIIAIEQDRDGLFEDAMESENFLGFRYGRDDGYDWKKEIERYNRKKHKKER